MSTQSTFQFELVSPEKKLISEPATYASIPGSEGEFGVLAGHASLISTLKAGVVEVTNANDNKEYIFIAGGFADVTATNVTILAEEAMPVSKLDRAAIETELSTLREDLGMAEGIHDKDRIRDKIIIAQTKLKYAA